MDRFGKSPVRALNSFGVAGLLEEGAQVFYSTLFSPRHIGRVSDLLAARLRDSRLDELRFRALLLYSVFEAAQAKEVTSGESPVFREPLVVECGIDSEKVVLGVSFVFEEGKGLVLAGLEERVSGAQPQDPMEALLAYLLDHAHRVVLRSQQATRRFEVAAVLGIPGQVNDAEYAATSRLEIVMIDDAPVQAPAVKAYIEIGDLDYPTLLRDDSPASKVQPSATGEILMNATQGLETKTTIAAGGKESESVQRISGSEKDAGVAKTVIAGSKDEVKDQGPQSRRISGTDLQDQSMILVKGAGGNASATPGANGAVGADGAGAGGAGEGLGAAGIETRDKAYQDKIAELERRIAQLQGLGGGSANGMSADGSGGAGSGAPGAPNGATGPTEGTEGPSTIRRIISRFFGKGKEAEQPVAPVEETAAPQEVPKPEAKDESPLPPGANLEAYSNKLVNEIQDGKLNETLNKAQKEMNDLKKENGNSKANRWMEGLMGELVAEKGRLHDMAKKINVSVRQKELEFQNKEQAFERELQRRDEELKQKTTALARAKDQLTQSNVAIERLRAVNQTSSDDAHFKQKFNQAHKLLTLTKEENTQLKTKIDELRMQLSAANFASKARSGNDGEIQNVQARLDRSQRQLEEMKKANKELMVRMAEFKKERSAATASLEDMRKKLEAAQKSSSSSGKDLEQLMARNVELEREEVKLKSELERLQNENKALKKVAASGIAAVAAAGPAAAGAPATASKPGVPKPAVTKPATATGAAAAAAGTAASPARLGTAKKPGGGGGTPPPAAA